MRTAVVGIYVLLLGCLPAFIITLRGQTSKAEAAQVQAKQQQVTVNKLEASQRETQNMLEASRKEILKLTEEYKIATDNWQTAKAQAARAQTFANAAETKVRKLESEALAAAKESADQLSKARKKADELQVKFDRKSDELAIAKKEANAQAKKANEAAAEAKRLQDQVAAQGRGLPSGRRASRASSCSGEGCR